MGKGVAVAADLHLQWRAWKKRAAFGDALWAWRWLVDFCVHSLPEALLLAGDLLDDDRPDYVILAAVRDGVSRLRAAGVRVIVVQGQHEARNARNLEVDAGAVAAAGLSAVPSSFFGLFDGVEHADGKSFEVGGKKFFGLDYLPPDKVNKALGEVPEGTWGLLTHQVWADLVPAGPARLSSVANASAVFTGDFHAHATGAAAGAGGQPLTVYSPGALAMQSISDDPECRFFLFDEGFENASSVEVPTRKCRSWTVEGREDLGRVFREVRLFVEACAGDEELPACLRVPVVQLRVPRGSDWADAAELELGDVCHLWVRRPGPAIESTRDRGPSSVGGDDPLRAALSASVAGGAVPPGVEADVLRFWASEDPAAEAESVLEECSRVVFP